MRRQTCPWRAPACCVSCAHPRITVAQVSASRHGLLGRIRCFCSSACASLFSDLHPASRAQMLSQAGPSGSRSRTALPTALLLLKRLWLLVPISGPVGVIVKLIRSALDAFGDHRAASPTPSVLGMCGAALKKLAARVCAPRSWGTSGIQRPAAGHARLLCRRRNANAPICP